MSQLHEPILCVFEYFEALKNIIDYVTVLFFTLEDGVCVAFSY